jgi:hypothetical protein
MHSAAAKSPDSYDAFAVWSARDRVRGIYLTSENAMRGLAGSPVDCCVYGIDAEGYLCSRVYGARIVHPGSLHPVKVEMPGHVYLFDNRDRHVVTLMAVRRDGRYEIDIAPASCSRPSWVPLAAGTRCYLDQQTAQLAGEAEFGVRRVARAARPVPVFVA